MAIKLLMIETSGFGGLAYYTYCLCNELSAFTSLDLTLLTNTDYELQHCRFPYKLIQKNLLGGSYFSAVSKLCDVVKRERPDIIHVQSLFTARKDWLLFLLAHLLRISVIYTAHNVMPHDEEERTAFGMRFVFRMICKWSKAIITHSESNQKALSRLYRIKTEKINIIKHGNYLLQTKDIKRYLQSDAKESLGLNADDEVVLFFGSVREYKGIMDLLLAIKGLVPNHLNLRLLIAGKAKGDIEEKIRSFFAENHLQKTIMFENRYIKLDEFGLYFDASDVVALPYQHSYGSGALQTAMAFSKPIILTDLSFFREIVIERKNGLFFEYGNIESLSEMIAYFFSLPREEQIRMAHNSYSIVEEDYGWQPIAEKTSSLYKQIAA